MKFVKGVVIGGLITTGFVMMYAETGKWIKNDYEKGKQLAKRWELCNKVKDAYRR